MENQRILKFFLEVRLDGSAERKDGYVSQLPPPFPDNGAIEICETPAMQEIGDAVGISLSTEYRYIKAMADDGTINYCGVRGITSPKTSTEVTAVALVSNIA